VLTLRRREDVRRQQAGVQHGRLRGQTIELIKVPPGQGI
jgi:hypothetical protein